MQSVLLGLAWLHVQGRDAAVYAQRLWALGRSQPPVMAQRGPSASLTLALRRHSRPHQRCVYWRVEGGILVPAKGESTCNCRSLKPAKAVARTPLAQPGWPSALQCACLGAPR